MTGKFKRPGVTKRAAQATKTSHAVRMLLKALDQESVRVGTHPPRKRPDVS